MKLFEELLEIIQNLIIKFMILTEKVKGNESLLYPSSSCRTNISNWFFWQNFEKTNFHERGKRRRKNVSNFLKDFTFLATRMALILADFWKPLHIKFLSVEFWHFNKKCTYWKNALLVKYIDSWIYWLKKFLLLTEVSLIYIKKTF